MSHVAVGRSWRLNSTNLQSENRLRSSILSDNSYVVKSKEEEKMSSLGTSKGVLEIAKFAVYVTIPIGLMYFFALDSKNLQKVMGNVIFLFSLLFLYRYMIYVVWSIVIYKKLNFCSDSLIFKYLEKCYGKNPFSWFDDMRLWWKKKLKGRIRL